MIDSHCHLADEAFAGDLEAVIARARSAGITGALCIGEVTDPAELARLDRVAVGWGDLRTTAGVHPHRAAALPDGAGPSSIW